MKHQKLVTFIVLMLFMSSIFSFSRYVTKNVVEYFSSDAPVIGHIQAGSGMFAIEIDEEEPEVFEARESASPCTGNRVKADYQIDLTNPAEDSKVEEGVFLKGPATEGEWLESSISGLLLAEQKITRFHKILSLCCL